MLKSNNHIFQKNMNVGIPHTNSMQTLLLC